MNYAEQVRRILGSGARYKTATACAIFEILEKVPSDEEKIKLLGIAFVERDSVPKQPTLLENPYILGDEKWGALNKKHLDMVRAFVKSTYFSTSSVDEFSSEMFRFLSFFKERDEKIFALSTILYYDSVMPYRQLPATPMHMPESEYAHLLSSNHDRIEMIRYIERLPFDDFSEEISMVLQIIDECEDNKPLRVALLTAYVVLVRNRYREQKKRKI